jgi:hypothetical protein
MNRLNYHFLRPSPTRSTDVSGDGQSSLVDELGVSPIRSRLLTGPHRCHPGIVQQAQGRSPETAVSPRHNNQSTIYKGGEIVYGATTVSEPTIQGKRSISAADIASLNRLQNE